MKLCKCGCGETPKSGKIFINGHNGRCMSPETLSKISNSQKNRWENAEEERIRYSEIMKEKMKGEKHSRWKGGISKEEYCPIFYDQDYKNSIRYRDNNECQNPFCKGKSVSKKKPHVHHINYNKKDCRPKNLITLCVSCNFRANSDRNWWKQLYQYKMDGFLHFIFSDLELLQT